jgi:hypothetical protein
MKTLRRMMYQEILSKVIFVTLGFVGLFFFFDLVEELKRIGQGPGGAYNMRHALMYVTLQVPNHVYELMPITVLIGTIFVMARLAQSSEFTILRTSGLGPFSRRLFVTHGQSARSVAQSQVLGRDHQLGDIRRLAERVPRRQIQCGECGRTQQRRTVGRCAGISI